MSEPSDDAHAAITESRTTTRSSARFGRARRKSPPARPGCGPARISSRRWTCCSSTRPASSRSRTCSPSRRPRRASSCSATPSSSSSPAGQPPRRHRRLGARAPPRRAQDHPPRAGPLPRRDLAAASEDLRLHLGALLRGPAAARGPTRRQGSTADAVAGAGLWFVPVPHEGNQNASPEEVERIAALVAGSHGGRRHWTDQRNDGARSADRHPDHRALQRPGRGAGRACPGRASAPSTSSRARRRRS